MPTLRRPIRTLRYVNDELLRAGEAIIRSSRAPQPPPRPDVTAGARIHPASTLSVQAPAPGRAAPRT